MWEAIARAKYIPEGGLDRYNALVLEVSEAIAPLKRPAVSEEIETPVALEA